MPLAANTRFEKYNRGDVISDRDEGRFRGTYPHSVVELSAEDLEALDAARKSGGVGAWIDEVASRPSLKDAVAAVAVPQVIPKRTIRKAQKPEPEPVAVDPVNEDGED